MHADIEKALVQPFEFKTSYYFKRSWDIFWEAPWMFIGAFIVWGIITAILSIFPIIGQIASTILHVVEVAGFYIVIQKMTHKESVDFNDFYKGFQFAGKLIIPYVLSVIIIVAGFFFLIIPGIYLLVAYIFVIPMALYYDEDVWNTLEASRKIVSKQWFSFLGFFLLLFLFNILGLICLGIGLLVTLPVSIISTYIIFKDIVQSSDQNNDYFQDAQIIDSSI
jgi:uncharacterized membrane protein